MCSAITPKNPNRKLPTDKTVFDGFLAHHWLPCEGGRDRSELIGPEIHQSRNTFLKACFFDQRHATSLFDKGNFRLGNKIQICSS